MTPLLYGFVAAPFVVIAASDFLHRTLWPAEEEGEAEEHKKPKQADRLADAHAVAASRSNSADNPATSIAASPAVNAVATETTAPVASAIARERERHQELADMATLEEGYHDDTDFAIPEGFSLADSRGE